MFFKLESERASGLCSVFVRKLEIAKETTAKNSGSRVAVCFAFSLFLGFHSTILKPDFDLSLSETQRVGNFNSPTTRQVTIKVKLLLQLQGLVPRVSLPGAFRTLARI